MLDDGLDVLSRQVQLLRLGPTAFGQPVGESEVPAQRVTVHLLIMRFGEPEQVIACLEVEGRQCIAFDAFSSSKVVAGTPLPRAAVEWKLPHRVRRPRNGAASPEDRMTASAPNSPPAAPPVVILLPLALLLHQVEEWFGGFPAWASTLLGSEITPERFLLINALGLAVFVVGALAARLSPQMAWFGVSLAALVGLNGVLHGLASLSTGSYSPGTVTGLLLYIPLSAIVLRSSAGRLSRPVFTGSVVFGVLVHALATFSALQMSACMLQSTAGHAPNPNPGIRADSTDGHRGREREPRAFQAPSSVPSSCRSITISQRPSFFTSSASKGTKRGCSSPCSSVSA